MTRYLSIVQPYVPEYRKRFFEMLIEALEPADVRLTVVTTAMGAEERLRGDAIAASWVHHAHPRSISLGRRRLVVTSTLATWRDADAVIVPVMGTAIDTYVALAASRPKRVGLWGHVASYVAPESRIDRALERLQMRAADHVFAYTIGGARAAMAAGVETGRVTAVMNSLDTAPLLEDIANISDEARASFTQTFAPNGQRLFSFIGGIDASKRISFLARSLEELHAMGSPVRVLVGGRGAQEGLLSAAVERGQVVMLGRLGGKEKALVLDSSEAILSPGRIGLLAVEALAAGRPILGASYRYNAPEAEYLVEGESLYSSIDDPKAYARLIHDFSRPATPPVPSSYPSIETMVQNFSSGVLKLLGEEESA